MHKVMTTPYLTYTGASKHKMVLEGPNATVNDLKVQIEEITEVPSDMQKIIFKGETVILHSTLDFVRH